MLGAKLWGEGVCGNVPFDHNPTSLDSFFIPLPLGHNILFSYVFSRVQCQQRYSYDCCLGNNKLCFTRDERIFVHNKREKQLPK